MTIEQYTLFENYMLSCMEDSAHDKEHIYRVLYNAMEIAKTEKHVDYDVLIAACFLHDIGRKEQYKNPNLCHAMIGADKAYQFLMNNHFDADYAAKVKHCIQTHRFRNNNLPQSIEAKILFDADKLDVAGAIGIARTLLYNGIVSEPLYTKLPDGSVSDGYNDTSTSFFQEYKFKLENLYDHFYTKKGSELARKRQKTAVNFYHNLFEEVNSAYITGKKEIERIIE